MKYNDNIVTPVLELSLDRIADNFTRISRSMPWATPYYAVKANPHADVLSTLNELGAHFDVASLEEIAECERIGIKHEEMSLGNTIKKPDTIRYADSQGIPTMVFDSESELEKIASVAPGSDVYCRIISSAAGAKWSLGRKFGCTPDRAVHLLAAARQLGLNPRGVSFHVGSQQPDPHQWEGSIAMAAYVFERVHAEHGIQLDLLNIGGGFPIDYNTAVPEIEQFGRVLGESIRRSFHGRSLNIMSEPGRYIAGSAGRILTRVVSVRDAIDTGDRRWVYLDIGRFGGLAETENEAVQYRIVPVGDAPGSLGESSSEETIIAGPTCDSADTLYRDNTYDLPQTLKPGDTLMILAAGAYTASYSSVGFNGFGPLRSTAETDFHHSSHSSDDETSLKVAG